MIKRGWIILTCMLFRFVSPGQISPVNRKLFFLDDRVIETTLSMDIRKIRNNKNNAAFLPASISFHFSDTSEVSGNIGVRSRGNYRKTNCDLASLMLNFKGDASPLSKLKELKLVGGCHDNNLYESLLIKEYLAYKIYNFISPMSFNVRLLHITYKDSRAKAKSYTQYAFLIEDIKEVAKRNNCVEIKSRSFTTEGTDRRQMNLVSIFQYMIGNTDWAVPVRHNIKLIAPEADTMLNPYAIPYDFDYSGLVNAQYAVPAEELGTKSVTERIYRGYPRNLGELNQNLDVFKTKKEQIMFYIENFPLLDSIDRKYVTGYLEEFFRIIDNKKSCKAIFIDNAGKP